MLEPNPALPLKGTHLWPKGGIWLVLGYGILGLGTMALAAWERSFCLNLLNTIIFLHVGTAALQRSHREPIATWGWRMFAWGNFAQAANQGWASFHMLRFKTPPAFPGWGDLLSYVCLGSVIATLLAWPLASASGSERVRKGLDGLGAGLSAFFWAWCIALGPLFKRPGSADLERFVMAMFFLFHATILGICAYLGARQVTRFRGPLGWITLGYGISTLQVITLVPLSLAGTYYLGHPLDLLVVLMAIVVLLAPLSPVPVEPNEAPGMEARDSSRSALLLPLLPASSALVAVLAALLWAPRFLDPPMIGMACLLAGLGLFRGLLALKDLQSLSATLEARVLERTQDLESMQGAMIRTERLNAMAVLGAGLAHDLNNSLATIQAFAELASERMEAGLLPQTKDLAQIIAAAENSATLTRRLLSYGRTEDEPPAAICLKEEITRMETTLRMLLRRNIALRLNLGDNPVLIRGVPSQIEQIMVNLVANARDAIPEEGDITIRLSTDRSTGSPFARVDVADTGEGMTPEVQASLFRPFFTTKGPGRGTGLGLASVHQIIMNLEGTLAVASEPGVGTTFVLRIPLISCRPE